MCLRIYRHRIAYSFVFAFLFSLLLLSGRSYASSYSFNYDSTSNPIPNNTTYNSTNVGFTPTFASVEVSNYDSQGYYQAFSVLQPVNGSYQVRFSSDSTGYSYNVFNLPSNTMYYLTNYYAGKTYNITLTFYDYNPIVSTPCPECPPIPDNPYDDKLDKIYGAILFVPAMAFVLYLFFIIYSWYVGGKK